MYQVIKLNYNKFSNNIIFEILSNILVNRNIIFFIHYFIIFYFYYIFNLKILYIKLFIDIAFEINITYDVI